MIENTHASPAVEEGEIPLLGQPGLRHRKVTSKMPEEEKSYIKAHLSKENWVQEEEQDGPLVPTQQDASTPPHSEKTHDDLIFK